VTLQTALAGVPGVTCYRTSGLSAMIGRRLVRMDRVILPNALLRREVYPFLFQEEATPARLAAHVRAIFAADQMPDKIGAGLGWDLGRDLGRPAGPPANCGLCCGVAAMILKSWWQRHWHPISSCRAEPGF
jgi:lipid-A-disaccharide synthase